MPAPSRRCRLTRCLVSALLLLFVVSARAQVPDPVTAAAAPVPGSGHSYIGQGGETVNPADGTPSFSLNFGLPAQRAGAFNFGIRYGGGEIFYLTPSSQDLAWMAHKPDNTRGGAALLEVGGWTYDWPEITFQEYPTNFFSDPNGLFTQCDAAGNFVFRGTGSRQSAIPGFGSQWLEGDPNYGTCTSSNPALSTEGPGGVQASMPAWSSVGFPDVTVTGPGGTAYKFPGYACCTNLSGDYGDEFGELASSITDRNGNQIALNSTFNGYTDTLGRNIVSWTGLGNSGDQIAVSGFGSVTLQWQSQQLSLPTSGQIVGGNNSCSITGSSPKVNELSEIDLPNGQKYTFDYDNLNGADPYGLLRQINYPGGGYVRYVYGARPLQVATSRWSSSGSNDQYCYFLYEAPVVTDRYVSFGAGEVLHQQFAYSTSWDGSAPYNWDSKTTTVTTTDMVTGKVNVVTYNYVPRAADGESSPYYNVWRVAQLPVESSVQTQDGSGRVLRTLFQEWSSIDHLDGQETRLDNGRSSAELFCRDLHDQITETDEYGFADGGTQGAPPGCFVSSSPALPDALGPLVRHTATVYHDFMSATPAAHIVNEPDSVTVSDGAGVTVQQTSFVYDAGGVQPSYATTGLVAPPGARGNITSVSRWVNTSNSWLTTSYAWFDTGQLYSRTDPAQHTTTFNYDDSPGSPGTHAYLTQVQFPDTSSPTLAHHVESYTWDYASGHLLSHKGQNGNITSFTYGDPLGRLTNITYPSGGGQTNVYYSDVKNAVSMDVQRQIDGSRWTDTMTLYDGMGHAISQGSVNDEPTPYDRVDTCLDGFGRPLWKSYPFQSSAQTGVESCSSPSSLPAGDTFTFDALGRPLTVTHSDGTQITTSYAGAATEIEDEGNGSFHVTRVLQHDGLGRLVSVCESDAGDANAGQVANSSPGACSGQIPGFAQDIALPTGFETGYSYDALGNLTQVTQGSETRTFTYDSLSRLLSADNPESNTDPSTGAQVPTRYVYDAPVTGGYCASLGTPASPGDLVEKTDARGESTCYWYDQLHRLTLKRFSDDPEQTRRVSLLYDQLSVPGYNFGDGIGRLTEEWVGQTPEENRDYSYDAMGRVTETASCAPANCNISSYWASAQYNLLGEVTQLTYPSGRVVATTYNRAGRATAVTGISFGGQATNVSYLTSATYTASGQPHVFTLGNGVSDSFGYDLRQRLTQRQTDSTMAGTGLNLQINRAADGDVASVADLLNGANTQSYGYDPLNRLASAGSGAWAVSEVYDRYGNRWQQNGTLSQILTFSGNNNRIDAGSNVAYDDAGDMTFDGVNTYCYDANGQILTAVPGAGGDCSTSTPLADYYYDAEGNRVEKQVNGVATDDAWWQGQLLAKRTGPLATSGWQDYIYAGGRRIARASNQVNRLVISGNNCSGCGWQAGNYTFSGVLTSYVIQSGDKLWFRQWQQPGSHGGIDLWFSNGNSNWVTTDSDGQALNDDQTSGVWHLRKVDLSQWAGTTLTGIALNQEGDTQAGNWEIQFEDIVLVEANGTVVPVYTGQPSTSLNVWAYPGASTHNYAVVAAALPDSSTGENDSTVWYHSDQVGTTRLLTNTASYPVWQGTFLPFGEEFNPQPDVSDVKFTGKPRDPETGLDNFGARYNSSTLGRFMTPDPFNPLALRPSAKLAWMSNPQRWNKYVYALDNPVSMIDPNGMNACGTNSDTNCHVTITFQSRPTNSKGQYTDQYTGMKNQSQYNATATVQVNGKVVGTYLARTVPSGTMGDNHGQHYATIANGTYSATLGTHDGQPALLINAGGKVPVVGGLDRATGQRYATGILVHIGGNHNWASMYPRGPSWAGVSEGCQLVCSTQYPSFLQAIGVKGQPGMQQQHFTVTVDTLLNSEESQYIQW